MLGAKQENHGTGQKTQHSFLVFTFNWAPPTPPACLAMSQFPLAGFLKILHTLSKPDPSGFTCKTAWRFLLNLPPSCPQAAEAEGHLLQSRATPTGLGPHPLLSLPCPHSQTVAPFPLHHLACFSTDFFLSVQNMLPYCFPSKSNQDTYFLSTPHPFWWPLSLSLRGDLRRGGVYIR